MDGPFQDEIRSLSFLALHVAELRNWMQCMGDSDGVSTWPR
jgi:hypothetical protein